MADQQLEVKSEQAPVKKEAPVVSETKVLDGAPPTATSGKKRSAKKQKTEPGKDCTMMAGCSIFVINCEGRLRLKCFF